jgi:hypothetical protein
VTWRVRVAIVASVGCDWAAQLEAEGLEVRLLSEFPFEGTFGARWPHGIVFARLADLRLGAERCGSPAITVLGTRKDRPRKLVRSRPAWTISLGSRLTRRHLPARLRWVCARPRRRPSHRIGEISITPHEPVVDVEGRPVRLTPMEHALLLLLARHAGDIVSRESSSARSGSCRTIPARTGSTSSSADSGRSSARPRHGSRWCEGVGFGFATRAKVPGPPPQVPSRLAWR